MDAKAKEILRKERENLLQKMERLHTEIFRVREEIVHIQDSVDAITLLVGDDIPHRPFKLTSKKGIKNLPVISIVRTILRDTAEPMDVSAIMAVLRECGLKDILEATVRTALVRLAEQPGINRVERGVYQFEGLPDRSI